MVNVDVHDVARAGAAAARAAVNRIHQRAAGDAIWTAQQDVHDALAHRAMHLDFGRVWTAAGWTDVIVSQKKNSSVKTGA